MVNTFKSCRTWFRAANGHEESYARHVGYNGLCSGCGLVWCHDKCPEFLNGVDLGSDGI